LTMMTQFSMNVPFPYRFADDNRTTEMMCNSSGLHKMVATQDSQLTTQAKLFSSLSIEPVDKQVGLIHSSSGYQPKVYLHKMGKRIEANHTSQNLIFNWPGSRKNRSYREKTQAPEGSSRDSPYGLTGDFSDLKNAMLTRLKQLLQHSKFYSLHDVLKQKESAKKEKPVGNKQEDIESAAAYAVLLAKKSGDANADDIKLGQKPASKVLQAAIAEYSESEVNELLELINTNFIHMITEPSGNYVVQQAMRRSHTLAKSVAEYCLENLHELVKNEFASRVMQALVEISPEFRRSVFEWYAQDTNSLLDSLPSVFLLAAALSKSEGHAEFKILRDHILSSQNKRLMANKFFRRLLVIFVDKCDRADLEVVYRTYKMAHHLPNLLNDKFGTLVLLAMLLREHRPLERLVVSQIKTNLPDLFQTKFFKLFVFRLIKSQGNWSLVKNINEALTSAPKESLSLALSSPEATYFYCALLVCTAEPPQRLLLVSLQALLERPTALRRALVQPQGLLSAGGRGTTQPAPSQLSQLVLYSNRN